MNKKILFLFLYIYMYRGAVRAQAPPVGQWATIPFVEFYSQKIQAGNFPDAVTSIDSVSQSTFLAYGSFDSARLWNTRGKAITQHLTGLHCFLRYTNGVLENPGDALAAVIPGVRAHAAISGVDYASMHIAPSSFAKPLLWKLNTATNTYDSIRNLTADGIATHILDWGNKKLLILGNVSDGFQEVNGKRFPGIALWNSETNALTHTTSRFGDVVGKAAVYRNDTLFTGIRYDLRNVVVYALPKGATVWKEDMTPPLRCHFPLALERHANIFYAMVGDSGILDRFALYRYTEGTAAWEKLAVFEPIDYTDYNAVRTFTYRNGLLYIAGLLKKCNEQTCFQAIAFDPAQKTFQNIGARFPVGLCNGIFWSDNRILLSMNENPYGNFFEQQLTYLVRDTMTRFVISGPDTTTEQHVTITVSVTGPYDSLTLYQYNPIGSPITYWLRADSTGKVQIPLTLAPGTYKFQGTTVNYDGWISALSPFYALTVSAVTGINDPPPTQIGGTGQGAGAPALCYPNPARTSVWLNAAIVTVRIYDMNGRDCGMRQFAYTAHDHELDVHRLSQGAYVLDCTMRNRTSVRFKLLIER